MTTDEDVVTRLSDTESWEFLRGHELGRLAFHLAGEVHIAPVNYTVSGDRVVFRTAEGSKLLGVTMNKDVAFEVDEVGDDRATSVVLRGTAVHLRGAEAEAAENLHLHPWVPTDKFEHVAIRVTEISGRRFRLDRSED
jgi:uncharacterized protein